MVMKLRQEAPDHWRKAKCRNIPVDRGYDPFFSEDEEETKQATDFCNGTQDGNICPIRHECLIFALVNNEKFGVWGGSTELSRKAIRKKYPSKRGMIRDEWKWQTEKESLKGLTVESLMDEDE
jgi:hypothetical protein